jgi:UDP-N-acetylmuramyl pentapeptide phosphotransferase/UDP-N-acetylglucosamine-1-phosphate transferase
MSLSVNLLKYPAVFAASGAVCGLALAVLGRCAGRCGLLDRPRERHIHVDPIPKIGGLAIFAGFLAGAALLLLVPWGGTKGSLDWRWACNFIAIGGLYLLLGVLDDKRELKPLQKLAGQMLVAGVAYWLGVRFGKFLGRPVPLGLDLVVTVVWFVAFVNAFNLIDGMDGVATGLAIMGGLGLFILFVFLRQPGSVLMVLAMLGACVVFLRYNFHPARYFLGDAGSMLLGAFFATVALESATKTMTVASLAFPLLLVGVPLLDSGLAIWRRILKAFLAKARGGASGSIPSSVMGGDLEHLHHRLANRGHSPRKVSLILFGISGLLIALGLLVVVRHSWNVGLAFLSLIILAYLLGNYLATVELGLSGDAIVAGMHLPVSNAFGTVFYPVFDCVALAIGSGLAFILARPILPMEVPLRVGWLFSTPILITFPLLFLFAGGAYRRLWSRARVSEYAALYVCVAAGCLAGVGVLVLFRGWPLYPAVLFAILLLFFNGGMVVGIRTLPRLAMDLAGWNRRRHSRAGLRRALVYGAGYKATLLLREMTFSKMDSGQDRFHLKGLIDDNPAAWGRIMHGYRILGGFDYLCRAIERQSVEDIIIACSLVPERLARLKEKAAGKGVAVERWHVVREPVT